MSAKKSNQAVEQKGAVARSKSIDHQINEEKERRQKRIQILVLGGAGSGKSTFIKQVRIHYGGGISDVERRTHTPHVRENLADGLNTMCQSMHERNQEFAKESNKVLSQHFRCRFPHSIHGQSSSVTSSPEETPDSKAIAESENILDCASQVNTIWNDSSMQNLWSNADSLKLCTAEEYFLNHLERILTPKYFPTVSDTLRIQKHTVGVQEHNFSYKGAEIRLIDVAGQKNQRKKWFHLFDGVNAIVFLASLEGYCLGLEEDPSLNQMHDSLQAFRDVIYNQYLKDTDIFLFLNKKDMFERAIKDIPLTTCFPKYHEDSAEATPAINYIREQFLRRKPEGKAVNVYVSNSLDLDLMKKLTADFMSITINTSSKKT